MKQSDKYVAEFISEKIIAKLTNIDKFKIMLSEKS